MMGRFLQVGTTEYFPSLKLQVWHLRDLLTWCVRSLFSSCFYQTLFDMLNGCCQQFPTRGKTPLLQIPSITSCRPKKNVCVKTSLKEKLRMHKPTIWRRRKKEVRGLRFSCLLKMGLDSGLTLHATLAFWKIHWNLQAKGFFFFFYFWCMINGFH